MGKLPESFEDWKWPWKEGEVDEDRAAKLIFNALKDKEKAEDRRKSANDQLEAMQTELDDVKASKGSSDEDTQDELKDLRKENRELKAGAGKLDPEHQKQLDRLNDVINLVDKGLPKALAMRVQGDDTEARMEDARELAEVAGVDFGDEDGDKGGDSGEDGGNPNPAQPPRQQPRNLRSGFEDKDKPMPSNPAKAAESLPSLYS